VRVALVGPASPDRGGIAQHTTELAHQLEARGQMTELAAWATQGPDRLMRRETTRPVDRLRDFPRTTRELHWRDPRSWWHVGRRLAASADMLVMTQTSPLQAPAFQTLSRAFRAARPVGHASTLLIAHNVLPHERHRGDTLAARLSLRAVDTVVVHSAEQADLANRLGARQVIHVPLPSHLFSGVALQPRKDDPSGAEADPLRLAFFGFVRPYKGLKELLEALAQSDSRVHLEVMGEFWEPIETYREMVEELGLQGRVLLTPEYVTRDEISALLARSDALVLPYRNATGSQMPRIAFAHGLPVIATDVADFSNQIDHGVDGLIVRPGDAIDLASAIERLLDARLLARLRSGVTPPDVDAEWAVYLDAVLALQS